MPEDVGGTPFPDGWEPDDDRGGQDEEFASVVFDEAFVRAAAVHEPTAVERLLAAAEARRSRTRGSRGDDDPYDEGDGYGYGRDPDGAGDPDDFDDLDDSGFPDGRYGVGPYGKQARWHRPVAWMLALVMGIGMVALAFTAVYRGANSSGGQDPLPSPASTGLERGSATGPPASADHSPPSVPAVPRTP